MHGASTVLDRIFAKSFFFLISQQSQFQVPTTKLLALDQVLKDTWSYLTILGLRQLAKDGAQREARKTYFWVPFRVFGLM
jgi:hypothetical protein